MGVPSLKSPKLNLLIIFQDPVYVLMSGWNSGKEKCVGKGEKGQFQGRKIYCLSLSKIRFVTVIGNRMANEKKKWSHEKKLYAGIIWSEIK